MTSFIIILAILTIVAVACIVIILAVPVSGFSDSGWIVVFCILAAALTGIGILGYNWDDILLERADQFMLTRDAAYACADMGPSSCKKSILEWQKDSTWYANHVSDILKNIKK